jgi:hypothetical protein
VAAFQPFLSGRIWTFGDICVAFYGHPGVFAMPTHAAIRQAREEGFPARMTPGISAEDCLFADREIDPGVAGWQSCDATDFLLHARRFDPTSSLMLWKVGLLGERSAGQGASWRRRMEVLLRRLLQQYGSDHTVALYEAPHFPGQQPVIRWCRVRTLSEQSISLETTLYVPPLEQRSIDPGQPSRPAAERRRGRWSTRTGRFDNTM